LKAKEPQNFNTIPNSSSNISKQNANVDSSINQPEKKPYNPSQQIANQNILPGTQNTVTSKPIAKPIANQDSQEVNLFRIFLNMTSLYLRISFLRASIVSVSYSLSNFNSLSVK
jgi:hypothetical protein